MNRLLHLLCALVLCLQLCGGHLGVLQVVAWSGMIVSFARTDGVVEAARKTFDGDYKCAMCHAIDATRDAEQKRGGSKSTTPEWGKFGKELVFPDDVVVKAPPGGESRTRAHDDPGWLCSADPAGPPSPPPRPA